MSKTIEFNIPEGYELDKEASKDGKLVYKQIEKKLSYEDVVKSLFENKRIYWTDSNGVIANDNRIEAPHFTHPNNATSEKQLQKLLAINKLMNVAKYLNGGTFGPKHNIEGYSFSISRYSTRLIIDCWKGFNFISPMFKTKKLAERAIEILGEETIRLALSQDY